MLTSHFRKLFGLFMAFWIFEISYRLLIGILFDFVPHLNVQESLAESTFLFTGVASCRSLKNQGVFVKHYAPGGNKVQKAIFSFKVTRSLTLVSFERVSLLEYACQI